jgi:hypothetical protein
VHHFGAIGLIRGLAVLGDRETRTHWDHLSGQAFAGPLAGRRLEVWPVHITTVAAALAADAAVRISISAARGIVPKLVKKLYPRFIRGALWFPFPFDADMSKPVDPRLDKQTQGLGVIVAGRTKFYPSKSIPAEGLSDDWDGRTLRVSRGAIDGVPQALWKDTQQEPMQLLSRWYAFASIYPRCDIYGRPLKTPHGGT